MLCTNCILRAELRPDCFGQLLRKSQTVIMYPSLQTCPKNGDEGPSHLWWYVLGRYAADLMQRW
jgi:hypothetical protein